LEKQPRELDVLLDKSHLIQSHPIQRCQRRVPTGATNIVPYPFFGLQLSPVVAAAAMALSSVSVIIDSLRLRTTKLD